MSMNDAPTRTSTHFVVYKFSVCVIPSLYTESATKFGQNEQFV